MEEIQYCLGQLVCATDDQWLGFWGGAVSAAVAFLLAITFEWYLRTLDRGKTRNALISQLADFEEALKPFGGENAQKLSGDAPEQANAYRKASAARSVVRWGLVRPDRLSPEQWRELENLRVIFDGWEGGIEREMANLRRSRSVTAPSQLTAMHIEIIEQLRTALDALRS